MRLPAPRQADLPLRCGAAALAVFLASLTGWWAFSRVYTENLVEKNRADLERRLVETGTELTTRINRRQALLTGLASFMELHGGEGQSEEHFTLYAQGLTTNDPVIRAIQVFPRNRPIMVYPLQGNEAVAGRSLEMILNDERPLVRADVERTIRSGAITLSNPYELRQGGMGLIARLAMFRQDELAGLVVIILDLRRLLVIPGLNPVPADLRLALKDSSGSVFYGDGDVFNASPVMYTVILPEGTWTLGAVPDRGWLAGDRTDLLYFWLSGIFGSLLVSVLTLLFVRRQLILSKTVLEQKEELTESAGRLRIAVEAAHIGFFERDLVTGRVRFSPEWKKQLGYGENDIPDELDEWRSRIHPDDLAHISGLVELHTPAREPEYESVYRIRHRDGSYLSMLSRCIVQTDSESLPVRILGCHIDVTEQKQAETRIHKLNGELQQRIREKELLLKEVHHRIKNNMSTVQGLLQLQSHSIGDTTVSAALKEAAGRVRSMAILYDRLFRSENYREMPIHQYLEPLIREILDVFPNRSAVRVETELESSALGSNLLSNLGIILNELLTNSMRHAFTDRTGGLIRISISCQDRRLRLRYQDNGKGIPESVTFEDSPGFGLQLIKLLANQLQGSLSIERDRGTTFLLEFPL